MRYAQALARKEDDIDGQQSPQSQESVSGNCDASRGGSVFTIGHSNHSAEKFVGLLKGHGIEVVADVRSQPYSRHAPHFNAKDIEATLSDNGIGRLFLGLELGGRPIGEEFYDADGRVDYARIESSRPFLDGIHQLERGIRDRRIALLCSEEDPAGCHRRLLVGRVLGERGSPSGTSGATAAFIRRAKRAVTSRSCSRTRR